MIVQARLPNAGGVDDLADDEPNAGGADDLNVANRQPINRLIVVGTAPPPRAQQPDGRAHVQNFDGSHTLRAEIGPPGLRWAAMGQVLEFREGVFFFNEHPDLVCPTQIQLRNLVRDPEKQSVAEDEGEIMLSDQRGTTAAWAAPISASPASAAAAAAVGEATVEETAVVETAGGEHGGEVPRSVWKLGLSDLLEVRVLMVFDSLLDARTQQNIYRDIKICTRRGNPYAFFHKTVLTDAALPRLPQAADRAEHQAKALAPCGHILVVMGFRQSINLGVHQDAEEVSQSYLLRCCVPEVIMLGGAPMIKLQAPDPAMAKYGSNPKDSMLFIRQLYRLLDIIAKVRPLVIHSAPLKEKPQLPCNSPVVPLSATASVNGQLVAPGGRGDGSGGHDRDAQERVRHDQAPPAVQGADGRVWTTGEAACVARGGQEAEHRQPQAA
jgi:hypothetical protein